MRSAGPLAVEGSARHPHVVVDHGRSWFRPYAEAELTLVETTTARGDLPDIHVERARLAGLRGDAPARERHFREAHRLFVEMAAVLRAEHVAAEMARGSK